MEDSASASDAVPRPRKYNCKHLLEIRITRIGDKLQYLQRLFRLLAHKLEVINQKVNPHESGLMPDWERCFKLTSQATVDIQPTAKTQPSAPKASSIVQKNLGRVRFYIPKIASDRACVQPRESLLRQQPIVKTQQVYRKATSVAINYQLAIFRCFRQRTPRVLTSSLTPPMGIAA